MKLTELTKSAKQKMHGAIQNNHEKRFAQAVRKTISIIQSDGFLERSGGERRQLCDADISNIIHEFPETNVTQIRMIVNGPWMGWCESRQELFDETRDFCVAALEIKCAQVSGAPVPAISKGLGDGKAFKAWHDFTRSLMVQGKLGEKDADEFNKQILPLLSLGLDKGKESHLTQLKAIFKDYKHEIDACKASAEATVKVIRVLDDMWDIVAPGAVDLCKKLVQFRKAKHTMRNMKKDVSAKVLGEVWESMSAAKALLDNPDAIQMFQLDATESVEDLTWEFGEVKKACDAATLEACCPLISDFKERCKEVANRVEAIPNPEESEAAFLAHMEKGKGCAKHLVSSQKKLEKSIMLLKAEEELLKRPNVFRDIVEEHEGEILVGKCQLAMYCMSTICLIRNPAIETPAGKGMRANLGTILSAIADEATRLDLPTSLKEEAERITGLGDKGKKRPSKKAAQADDAAQAVSKRKRVRDAAASDAPEDVQGAKGLLPGSEAAEDEKEDKEGIQGFFARSEDDSKEREAVEEAWPMNEDGDKDATRSKDEEEHVSAAAPDTDNEQEAQQRGSANDSLQDQKPVRARTLPDSFKLQLPTSWTDPELQKDPDKDRPVPLRPLQRRPAAKRASESEGKQEQKTRKKKQ